jgi:hypothetical protein
MRRILPPLLVGLGLFLFVTGLLARFYAYPQLAQTPVDQNGVTYLEATGATLFDTTTLAEITTDLSIQNRTVGDVEASEAAPDGVQVWVGTTSVRDSDGVVRSRSAERVAFDAHTGEAVNCDSCDTWDESTEGERVPVEREGLVYKWPFGTEKKDYVFWDSNIMDTITMKYVEEETIDGLKVYKFHVDIPPTVTGTTDVPGTLVGQPDVATVTADNVYTTSRDQWVEPVTGAIVDRSEDSVSTLAVDGQDVVTTMAGNIHYTADQVKTNVDAYSANATQLKLVHLWVPLAGVVVGLLAIGAGVLLGRRSRGAEPTGTRKSEPATETV